MFLHVVTTNYGVLLASQALFGLGWTFRSGADVAWLTDEMAALGDTEPGVSLDALWEQWSRAKAAWSVQEQGLAELVEACAV